MSFIIQRPVLRYHGGKWKLAHWIISHFPNHRVYTEAYGGAASVLMRKSRSYAEVYNDMYDNVVTVFRVLRDQPEKLKRALELTPFARTEFEQTTQADLDHISDPVELARRVIFRSFAGFGSAAMNANRRTGFRVSTKKALPSIDWANYPSQVEAFAERLRGVVIENRPAIEVLLQHDGPDTLHYVDPPYPHITRSALVSNHSEYAHEMYEEHHIELADTLKNLEGMVVLSGYRCELYDDLFGDWEMRLKDTHADGAKKRQEAIWLNPPCAEKQKQLRFDYA